jgi:hypothetical protein
MNNENKKEPSKEIIEEEYRLGKEYYNNYQKKKKSMTRKWPYFFMNASNYNYNMI